MESLFRLVQDITTGHDMERKSDFLFNVLASISILVTSVLLPSDGRVAGSDDLVKVMDNVDYVKTFGIILSDGRSDRCVQITLETLACVTILRAVLSRNQSLSTRLYDNSHSYPHHWRMSAACQMFRKLMKDPLDTLGSHGFNINALQVEPDFSEQMFAIINRMAARGGLLRSATTRKATWSFLTLQCMFCQADHLSRLASLRMTAAENTGEWINIDETLTLEAPCAANRNKLHQPMNILSWIFRSSFSEENESIRLHCARRLGVVLVHDNCKFVRNFLGHDHYKGREACTKN